MDSLALIQGALSIWSYCDDIPSVPGQPGYLYKVLADRYGPRRTITFTMTAAAAAFLLLSFSPSYPVLLAGALRRRSASAVVALLLPVTVWLNLFGGLLSDKSHPGGELTVASHNVGADNPDPVGTARDLAASGADVLALEELTPQARGTYEKELAKVGLGK